jgi:hypothetical protein
MLRSRQFGPAFIVQDLVRLPSAWFPELDFARS